MQIADAALVAAATLSDRYITARFLPDKAIDLVDEAASRLRMEIDSRPVEIDELQRAVDRLKMEELALAEGDRRGLASSGWSRLRARPGRQAGAADRADRPLGAGEGRPQPGRRAEEAARRAARPGRAGPARGRPGRPRPELLYARDPGAGDASSPRPSRPRPRPTRRAPMVKEEVGPDDIADGRRRLDRHPGRPAAGGRDRQAAADGGRARPAGGRPARGRAGGRPTPCAGPGPASPTPTGRPARSCSSARPASARPSWPRRWPTSCSTTSGRWSAST